MKPTKQSRESWISANIRTAERHVIVWVLVIFESSCRTLQAEVNDFVLGVLTRPHARAHTATWASVKSTHTQRQDLLGHVSRRYWFSDPKLSNWVVPSVNRRCFACVYGSICGAKPPRQVMEVHAANSCKSECVECWLTICWYSTLSPQFFHPSSSWLGRIVLRHDSYSFKRVPHLRISWRCLVVEPRLLTLSTATATTGVCCTLRRFRSIVRFWRECLRQSSPFTICLLGIEMIAVTRRCEWGALSKLGNAAIDRPRPHKWHDWRWAVNVKLEDRQKHQMHRITSPALQCTPSITPTVMTIFNLTVWKRPRAIRMATWNRRLPKFMSFVTCFVVIWSAVADSNVKINAGLMDSSKQKNSPAGAVDRSNLVKVTQQQRGHACLTCQGTCSCVRLPLAHTDTVEKDNLSYSPVLLSLFPHFTSFMWNATQQK